MNEFKKLIDECGLNMPRWAEILGYSHDTLLSWSCGRLNPNKEAVRKLNELSRQIDIIFKEK
jgi:DNA-binding transcriptional regulator YiaG